MKIACITAHAPWGRGEAFIIKELSAMKRQGINLIVIPRSPGKEVFHREAEEIAEDSLRLPLVDIKMFISFCGALLTSINTWKLLGVCLFGSRNPLILIKNLSVFPKGVYLSKAVKKEEADHIYAHWGSTTATLAWIVSKLTGIPWSFTLHRWDITENNMLEKKVDSAGFARCISENGKDELLEIIGGRFKEKIKVLHLGVEIPAVKPLHSKNEDSFTIVVPANLVNVKGHRYLIEACRIIADKGIDSFKCEFYGDGPLREDLEKLIKKKGLTGNIELKGSVPQEELIALYKENKADLVVLPSITTENGEHEGIPASLIEAMSYGIPVISTKTGGIPELVSEGCGLLVEEKSPIQLAEAIMRAVKEDSLVVELSSRGHQKVRDEFDIEKNIKTLINLFK